MSPQLAPHPKPLAQPLHRLLAGYASGVPEVMVSGIALDSRRVQRGDAFLAVRGGREHGLTHLPQALARGAAAIVWEPAPAVGEPEVALPCVAVEQLSIHVGAIAARFFGEPSRQLHVVGVTGTDGKTSTAHLIAQALEALGHPCAYVGTLGSGRLDELQEATHTTPDPIALQAQLAQFVGHGCTHCAMEVSSHALDQNRVGGVCFGSAVLTNVSRDHLDYHGTVEAYAQAKRRLFEAGDGRRLILNRDDATGRQWADQLQPCTVYGLDGDRPGTGAFVLGRGLQLHAAGLSLEIDSSWGTAQLSTHLLGRFNACNLLAALAALLHAGVSLDAALAALARVRTVPGRIEGFRGAQAAPLVVVDYAHTPQALEQVLTALRAHTRGALICVFGCGGDRDRGKRPLMGAVAGRLADRVIVTDDNPRGEDPAVIVEEILAGLPSTRHSRESGNPAAPLRSDPAPGGRNGIAFGLSGTDSMSVPDKAKSPSAGMTTVGGRGSIGVSGIGTSGITVIHDRAQAIRQAIAQATADDVVLIAGKGHETTQTYGAQVREFSDRAVVAALLGSAH